MDGWSHERSVDGVGENGTAISEEEIEWRVPGFLHTDDMALFGSVKENLRIVIRSFIDE